MNLFLIRLKIEQQRRQEEKNGKVSSNRTVTNPGHYADAFGSEPLRITNKKQEESGRDMRKASAERRENFLPYFFTLITTNKDEGLKFVENLHEYAALRFRQTATDELYLSK